MQDNSNDEVKIETTREELEDMTLEYRIIKAIDNIGGKPRLDIPIYSRSLNPKELIE